MESRYYLVLVFMLGAAELLGAVSSVFESVADLIGAVL